MSAAARSLSSELRPNRIPMGIVSLDRLIEGGLQKGDTIIVAGQPGTGKTTLGLQFLHHGATVLSESGIYASLIESAAKLKRNAKRFGWDFDRLESQKLVQILELQTTLQEGINETLQAVLSSLRDLRAQRLVFDSLSALMMAFETSGEARSFLHLVLKFLEATRCTSLLLSEVPWGAKRVGTGIEEFLGDGLIVLEANFDGFRVHRKIYIAKMRGTEHRLEGYEYYISRDGFNLVPVPISSDVQNVPK